MKPSLLSSVMLLATLSAHGADPIFSGPQVGERTTPFPVLELWGPNEGTKRDPISENAGAATAIVFIHTLERSLVPLLKAIDQYGAERSELIKTEVVFLFDDRVQGEQRGRAAAGSLRLNSRVGLSLDGAEGPGNYGINKECMMTIVAAKDNTVRANFALVQPGIVDAPRVIAALASACGDPSPPSIETLTERAMGARESSGRMMRPSGGRRPVDLTALDLSSEVGLREAVRALIGEVQRLRSDLDQVRGPDPQPQAETEPGRDRFPGAIPDDPKLNSLLREAIRQSNDNGTVDKVMAEMQEYIRGDNDLTQQAVEGWKRVLHFGDRYGTAHARALGRAFLEKAQLK